MISTPTSIHSKLLAIGRGERIGTFECAPYGPWGVGSIVGIKTVVVVEEHVLIFRIEIVRSPGCWRATDPVVGLGVSRSNHEQHIKNNAYASNTHSARMAFGWVYKSFHFLYIKKENNILPKHKRAVWVRCNEWG